MRARNGPERRGARRRQRRLRKRRSVRAGTDQAKNHEGARDGGAARRSKCHVSTHPDGRSIPCVNPTESSVISVGGINRTQSKVVQTCMVGAGTLTEALDELTEPCSTSSQPSCEQGWPAEQQTGDA